MLSIKLTDDDAPALLIAPATIDAPDRVWTVDDVIHSPHSLLRARYVDRNTGTSHIPSVAVDAYETADKISVEHIASRGPSAIDGPRWSIFTCSPSGSVR